MLPGFRFLFAATVLSVSLLIFGLGAAALLRAAHEEFASIPSRRAPPETIFAQRSNAGPALAMLRAEPAAVDEKAINPPAADNVQDQPAIVSTPAESEKPAAEPDKIAALTDTATPAENSPQALAKTLFFVFHDLLRQHDYRSAEMKPRSACGIFQYPF